ncbi:MAG: L-histidine N(alpha)-methyltransferase [Gemmataceae bacterium]
MEIVADERIALIDRGLTPTPQEWVSRVLYFGETGARYWLSVIREPTYPLRDPSYYNLGANRLTAVKDRHTTTFVSLGSGDGLNDLELVRSLSGPWPGKLRYIPVDISLPLLREVIANLQPHVKVPVGILCDFEDGRDFLADTLRRYIRPPALFALLGGTIGNLDAGEQRFFVWMRSLLGVNDAFLLDLPLAGPGWTPDDEPRLKPQAYTSAFRRFLAEAMDRNDPGGAVVAFDKRVELSLTHDAEIGAEVILVADRFSRRPLLTFRRYRWEPMLNWFRSQGFAVEFARSSITSDQDKFGMGVVLLTAR